MRERPESMVSKGSHDAFGNRSIAVRNVSQCPLGSHQTGCTSRVGRYGATSLKEALEMCVPHLERHRIWRYFSLPLAQTILCSTHLNCRRAAELTIWPGSAWLKAPARRTAGETPSRDGLCFESMLVSPCELRRTPDASSRCDPHCCRGVGHCAWRTMVIVRQVIPISAR